MPIDSIEDLARLSQRLQAGETVPDEELAEAIEFTRKSRMAVAGRVTKTDSKKQKADTPSFAALLTQMINAPKKEEGT